jgi:hypothetical protein
MARGAQQLSGRISDERFHLRMRRGDRRPLDHALCARIMDR